MSHLSLIPGVLRLEVSYLLGQVEPYCTETYRQKMDLTESVSFRMALMPELGRAVIKHMLV